MGKQIGIIVSFVKKELAIEIFHFNNSRTLKK